MISEQISSQAVALRLCKGGLTTAILAAAVFCCGLFGVPAAERSRGRLSDSADFDSCWMAAPTVCADVTACPAVTCPEATVARFSVFPLSMIAMIVDVRVAHGVCLARIGGLYGP